MAAFDTDISIRMLDVSPGTRLVMQLPANAPGKEEVLAQTLEPQPPGRESSVALLAPDCSLVQPCCNYLRNEQVDGEMSVSLPSK